jgi:hypothetical protein
MNREYRQAVLIERVDSASRIDRWTDLGSALKEARALVRTSTVAFVLRRTRQFVLLPRSHDDQENLTWTGRFRSPSVVFGR